MRIFKIIIPLTLLSLGTFACTDKKETPQEPIAETPQEPVKEVVKEAPVAAKSEFPKVGTLLMPQAQFEWITDEKGKRKPVPGPAKLLMLSSDGDSWQHVILEDKESRVFHKAACVNVDGEERLLTIAGTDAMLKLWREEKGEWKSETLWHPSFGGKWDRLRDFEIADVDGDGQNEIVVATHDQGVIAIIKRSPDGWKVEEVYKEADTFVHEIEIGDTDGDGKKEFFATPSKPNKVGKSQPGHVMWFRKGAKVKKGFVAEFKDSHAKEILAADVDGDGKDEIYIALEATRGKDGSEKKPVRITRNIWNGKKYKGKIIARLPGAIQSRVVMMGDLTGSGKNELVVTTMKGGIWRLVPGANGKWEKYQIDAETSGFEHAAGIADVDGDGKSELYVAADDQDEVRRYRWIDGAFKRDTIYTLKKNDLTWNVQACESGLKL